MSYDNFNADANQVFNYHPSSGFKVKASHRLSLSDSLTASLYTRLARSADNATTSISLVPKFKFVRDDFSATAAVFAGSNAAPQLELTATIYNFLINGLRNTITFATPSFGANGKDLNAQATLTTNSRLFLESSRATLDVTSDLPRGSASVALALPLPQALTAGFKAALDQGVGVKSLDVALQLGASGLTITGKGLATAAPAVWNASYYARLSQTLAIAAEVDSLRYVRVGALHDATPFTALRVKLDNNSRAAIAADTVFSSALSGSFGVDFDVNNRRDLKWGVSLKFH